MKSNPTLQILGLWRCPSAIGNWLGAIVSSVVLCHSTLPCTAGLPEPYNLIYGAIEMDGKWVTAADTNVTVEARRLPTGAAIASYRMGSQSAATNFYALKVRLESPAPADIMKAASTGTTLYITVLKGATVKNQLEYEMGQRGGVMRLDFGNIDSDNDGLPDGWEQAYLLTLGYNGDDDPDGDGVSNRNEYALGTNPSRADARHPADLDQDWVISVPELAAYYGAWKKGQAWTVAPTNITLEYVTRATYLWEQGGYYKQDITVTNAAPLWWVTTSAPTNAAAADVQTLAKDLSPTGPLNVVTLGSVLYQAGQPISLTNRVSVATGLRTYAVEQFVPRGWTLVSVGNGVWDSTNNKAKWGPFFDRASRDLVVTVMPPPGASGLLSVPGVASYDGHRVTVTGVRTVADAQSLASRMALKPNGRAGRWAIDAVPGSSYVLESSTDLKKWEPVTQAPTDDQGRVELADPDSAAVPMRFYRARLIQP
ncbi:MAG: hypothetical protein WCL11_00040 [Verrucomicrobiota bacterium]